VEEGLDYKELYRLQDKVLDIVFDLENEFYLTGGTALHRFYYNARFSDDLDFFVSNGINFGEDVKEIIQKCEEEGLKLDKIISSRDFYRIKIFNYLQIDFVNDRVYRYKKSKIFKKYKIDNIINILTNKITAIIDRDEEKDIFDLFCIAYNEEFSWSEVLKIANKKSVVEKDMLICRLQSFPLNWLEKIKKIKKVKIDKNLLNLMCEDIIEEKNNSLKGKNGFS